MKARSEEYVLRSFLTRKEDWFFVKRLLSEVSDIGNLTSKIVFYEMSLAPACMI